MRWSSYFFPTYFTPKSSTTSVNCTGCHSCFQSPGVILLCCWPRLLSIFSSSLLDSSPDYGNPYMPRLATIYTTPFVSIFSLSLHYMMISSGMYLTWMRMYSGRLSGVMRYNYIYISSLTWPLFVDMTLLNRILATSISAVGVATLPG